MQLEPRGPLPPVLGEGESALLFDAECVVCSGWVHFVLRWDRAGALRIGAVQSDAGRALLEYAGLDPDDVDTMLLIERGVPYAKSSAFLRAVLFFRFPMNLLSLGLIAVALPLRIAVAPRLIAYGWLPVDLFVLAVVIVQLVCEARPQLGAFVCASVAFSLDHMCGMAMLRQKSGITQFLLCSVGKTLTH